MLHQVLPNRRAKTLLARLEPLFAVLNTAIWERAQSMTYDEMKVAFAKHDVW